MVGEYHSAVWDWLPPHEVTAGKAHGHAGDANVVTRKRQRRVVELEDHRVALHDDLGPEDVGVELAGPILVAHDEQDREHHPLARGRNVRARHQRHLASMPIVEVRATAWSL